MNITLLLIQNYRCYLRGFESMSAAVDCACSIHVTGMVPYGLSARSRKSITNEEVQSLSNVYVDLWKWIYITRSCTGVNPYIQSHRWMASDIFWNNSTANNVICVLADEYKRVCIHTCLCLFSLFILNEYVSVPVCDLLNCTNTSIVRCFTSHKIYA